MRAAAAAGREVFGYNRSIDAVQAAKFDGFDATENLDEALARAADSKALIVLAVPVPALPLMLGHIRDSAPECPLTDVTSVKGAVLEEVQSFGLLERFVGGHPMAGTAHSGWAAGNPRLFVGAPWVISVDDHVDADVWTMVMNLALDCGSVVVPARSDEHDAAAATISHLPHLLAEALAITAGEVPLAFALAAGSFRDGTRVAATAPDLVRAMCEANADQLLPVLERTLALLGTCARRAGREEPADRAGRGRSRRPHPLRQLQQTRDRHHRHRGGELARGARRGGSCGWGDQIRSASPG